MHFVFMMYTESCSQKSVCVCVSSIRIVSRERKKKPFCSYLEPLLNMDMCGKIEFLKENKMNLFSFFFEMKTNERKKERKIY